MNKWALALWGMFLAGCQLAVTGIAFTRAAESIREFSAACERVQREVT